MYYTIIKIILIIILIKKLLSIYQNQWNSENSWLILFHLQIAFTEKLFQNFVTKLYVFFYIKKNMNESNK